MVDKEEQIDVLAKKIWDYMLMHQPLKKADCIFVGGAKDTRPAQHAAGLYLQGYAPWLICSGGKGRITKDIFDKTEAETCAEIAIKKGVPKEKIILENQSASTFENIIFTRKILETRGMNFNQFILVHKPYMERRLYATFKAWWPEKNYIVTSPPLSYEEYPDDVISKELMINGMVGDLQRLAEYSKKWWSIPQEIPSHVWRAYEQLIALGYTKQLIKEEV